MLTTIAVLAGFGLDLLLGDPSWLLHPVVIMGRVIGCLERSLRRLLPATASGELLGGTVLAVLLPVGTWLLCGGLCLLATRLHPLLGLLLQVLWCWQALAMRGLRDESSRVQAELERGDLAAARTAVGRIVGRDTAELDSAAVTRATVETVAENFADGVIAPLCYLLLGGAPLALAYKAVNTMDSMVGYKNDRYLYFGRAAARLDDLANYLPARLAALLWVVGAGLSGQDMHGSYRIWRRDRRCHASPNSAQTEAACAGALGVQLAGNASYFGKLHHKPTIGDPRRDICPDDIARANRVMYVAGVTALLLGVVLRCLIL